MKAIIDIREDKGCLDCPYCHYEEFYDEYGISDSEKDGFYCYQTHPKKKIADFYNTEDGNGILIPDFCLLNFIKE